ncbi:MAG: hypothetical protein WCN92_13905, partial [Eubacteriales bacterium]
SMAMDKAEMMGKLKRGLVKPVSLLKLKFAVDKSKEAKKHTNSIPEVYDKAVVDEWRKKLESYIK